MADPIVVVPYDPQWPAHFAVLGQTLRQALGIVALRIDHIGSTAVSGLDAKPILDVQISVASLDPREPYQIPLESVGFHWQKDNPDLTKRYFREGAGMARTHVHVRKVGSWSEQFALLFRDYLRAHATDAAAYARLKYQLSERYRDQREMYVEEKGPFIWAIMVKANQWSQQNGWSPGPTDQ